MIAFCPGVFTHLPREQNTKADKLANEALDQAALEVKGDRGT